MAILNVEVQAQVDGAVSALGRLNKSFDLMDKANQDAAGALSTFGVNLSAFNNPLTATATLVKASIDYTLRYADSIDQLARVTGTGAREASILATVMGDLNVSTGTLEQAAKKLKDKGLTPSLETIKKLSVEYRAIQDPAERNKFLFDNLGRAGLEMADALDRDVSQFDELAQAASTSGKVLDEAMIQRMEDAQIKAAKLQDRVDGLKVTVGTFAVDTLSDAADGLDNTEKMMGALWIKTQQLTGAITDEEAAMQAEILATGGLHTAFDDLFDDRAEAIAQSREHADVILDEKEASKQFQSAMDDLGKIMSGELSQTYRDYAKKQSDLTQQMADARAEVEKLTTAHGKQVTVTHESETSSAELFLAQDKLAQSTIKLQEANIKLTESTDPEEQHELAVKVAEAQVSFDKAKGSVEEMGGSVETWTINNNKKIDEQKDKLKELEAAYAENAKAHEEATARIIFGFIQQRVTADGVQEGEIAFLAEIGKAWGLYDERTASALDSVDKALSEHGLNAEAVIKAVGDSVNGLPTYHEIVIQTIVRGPAAGDIGLPGGTEAPVNVPITPEAQPTPGGAFQHGGSFIIPPGYNESFPIGPRGGASSGERVTVTPTGGAGGEMNYQALMMQMESRLTRAFRDALLMARS